MLFFIVPFFWIVAIPAILVGILVIRGLFWLRSLGRPNPGRTDGADQPVIEGQFLDDEAEKPEDGSYPSRNQLEKRP